MHISFVHLGEIYPYYHGGPARVAYNIVRQLDKANVKVDLLTLSRRVPSRSDLGLSANVALHAIGRRPGNTFRLISEFLGLQGSLIHVNFLSPRLPDGFMPLMRFLKPVPVIGSVHGYIPWELQLNNETGPKSWLMGSAFRTLLMNWDRVVVFSEYMKRLLSIHVPEPRIQVLPLGVNLQEFNRVSRKARKDICRILFVGRLVPVKGVEFLIKALRVLRGTTTQTYIVGDGILRPRIESLIRQLPSPSSVTMCGIVSEETKLRYLSSADIMVVPSIYEPIPTVILEAFAAGVPVIATNIGGIPEIVHPGFNGLLVEPGNHVALASAIELLVRDHELRRKLSRNAKSSVEKYDWSFVAKRYKSFYEQVLGV